MTLNPTLEKRNDFPVARIVADPDRFQYKQGYEADTGAGLGLTNIRKYDPGLAGRLTLFHDGKYFVVNGHQRLAAMRRFRVKTCDVQIMGAPENSASDARAYGAILNIAEGHGTALDAAIFMRETKTGPEYLEACGVDMTESTRRSRYQPYAVENATALYHLSDGIFRGVQDQTIAEHTAVVLGRELPDDEPAQVAVLKSLTEMKSMPDSRLTELIRLAKGAGTATEEQTDLFGTHTLTSSLVPQQAEIMAYVRDCLRKDRRLFGTVLDNHQRLKAARTKVDCEAAQEISAGSALRIEMLDRSAYFVGTDTNATIRKYAAQLAKTEDKPQVLRTAYSEVFEALARDHRRNFPNAKEGLRAA